VIALAQRRIDEAEACLCREWHGIRDPAALAGTLAAEHMRALIYGATAARRGVGAVPSIRHRRTNICAIQGSWQGARFFLWRWTGWPII
jgi:hypothetical protein